MHIHHHLLILLLAGCGSSGSPSPLDQPTAVSEERPGPIEPTAVPLARRSDQIAELVLPASSRPKGAPAPARFGLVAPLEQVDTHEGVAVYRSPLPIHSNLLPTKLKGTHVFGSGAPPGLEVIGPSGLLRFARMGRAVNGYGFDRDWLYVGIPAQEPAPDWTDYALVFPRATSHEDGLNRATSKASDAAFVARNLTLDEVSTTGLFLPAPARASWSVTVPADGVLTTRGTVLPPAIRTADRTDGAVLHLELLDGTEVVAHAEHPVGLDTWTDVRWSVADQAGKQLTLQLRTEPGGNPLFDYVFIEEPTLYTPSANPRRTVLVFVDTLRPDHLGIYGHDRATSPFLDRWAQHAAVFDNARSVAPWTLPSARSALTGFQPEDWYAQANVAERFADAGWATEAIVANAFLSQPFDMHRGWTRFRYQHLWPADEVAGEALAALERHPDRDLLLMVHFMDPHLPYSEPTSYRYRWASFRSPDGYEPSRARLYDAKHSPAEQESVAAYVKARYDQNIRFVDDQLRAVLERAGPDATTALFSDHGEEFWEHGSFEHGHSFHDEVLRVPLVIRGPHAPAGRYDAPVSLLDLTPTLLELSGLPTPDGPGVSLVDLLYRAPGAANDLADRPQAFGRPLYEQDGWAVLEAGHKWIDRAGVRRVYALEADPVEQSDVAATTELEPYPDALAEALDRDVLRVWRVRPKVRLATGGSSFRVSHPEGIREAWASYDPRGRSAAVAVVVREGELFVTQPPGAEMPNAIFVVPAGDWAQPVGLSIRASAHGQPDLEGSSAVTAIGPGPQRNVLLTVGDKGWSFLVDTAHIPIRSGVEVSGFHEDVRDQLRELGYLDD